MPIHLVTEMKWLGSPKDTKLTQEDSNNLNSPIRSKESVVKIRPGSRIEWTRW